MMINNGVPYVKWRSTESYPWIIAVAGDCADCGYSFELSEC